VPPGGGCVARSPGHRFSDEDMAGAYVTKAGCRGARDPEDNQPLRGSDAWRGDAGSLLLRRRREAPLHRPVEMPKCQSQDPEQGTNAPSLLCTVTDAPVSPAEEALTVMAPGPVARMIVKAMP